MTEKIKVLGYYVHEDDSDLIAENVIVAIEDDSDFQWLTCYCPIGQHSQMSREYFKECESITKDQYINASEGYYTPEEYL